jgi:transcriptional regulator with XRE-family HTH domain
VGGESWEVTTMQVDDSIGARIATERKLRGLTQQQLADRAHTSVSLLRKVEQGNRATSAALITSVAKALGVTQGKLTGQPFITGDRRIDAVHDLIADLRGEVVAYQLPPDDDLPPRPLEDLAATVRQVSRLRQHAHYTRLGAVLPEALRDLRAASFTVGDADREWVMGLLAETYDSARQFAYKLGYSDLATLLADRYAWAAAQSGDPLAVAVGDTMRAAELIAAGHWTGAERVMDSSMANLEPDLTRAGPEALAVYGYLHLEAALATARAGKTDATWAHHAEAVSVAERIGVDRDDYRLAFGPTNAAIWGTALGVELLDAPAALNRAAAVHITEDTPRERAGHHFIDLARARAMNGDNVGALEALMIARRIAPQQTRYHPLARDVMQALARTERRSTETLRGLAAWMGVQD